MNARKKRIQKIVAMLLVFVMMMANFALVGEKVIAYTIEATATSNKNVEISAYFQNSEGEKVNEIDQAIDKEDLKLIIAVTVKNDDGVGGYFEGNINVGDSNFKLVNEEEISIHVDAGNTETIEKEIAYLDTDNLTEEYLNKESKIVINGKYINSEGEYEITGEAGVTVKWKAPENAQAILATKVLTNNEYQINEENKRIVQLLVGSKIGDNPYPVKSTVINIDVPDGVEEVKVHKRTTNATNGDQEFTEENYIYENGKLIITIENNGIETNVDEENINKINWNKNTQDILVITYKYPEGTDLSETEIELNSKITTYDGTELTAESTAYIEEEIDGIVTSTLSVSESEIYKGKIYSGEGRDFNTTTQINIDNVEATEKIELSESKATFVIETEENEEEVNANIKYVKTEINKEKFIELFGEEGYIIIQDQDGNVVANITNDSETDDDGNIVINYNDVNALKIETSKPVKEGILKLNHTKTIENSGYSRDEIGVLTGIKEIIETRGKEDTNIISLVDTETKASLSTETTNLITGEENQKLNLRVTLETNDETKDLYKNPEIKITLPEQIQVTSARYRMLYGNGLESSEATVTTENGRNIITILLEGEQTTYEGDAINGTIIDIIADVEVDSLATTSTEEINLIYTNENRADFVGEETTQIEIVSESDVILTNVAQKAGIELIGSGETEEINLELEAKATNETISMQIINNEGKSISDITVLGKLPTDEGNIELSSSIKTNIDADIYYTEVNNPTSDINDASNGWSETPTTNSENYLVVVNSLGNAQELSIEYNISIEENLDYSIKEKASYSVTYTTNQTEEKVVNSSAIVLNTNSGTNIETNVIATVGGEEIEDEDEVRAGEVIEFSVSVTNVGTDDIEGVNITSTIPNNTTLVTVNESFWDEGQEEEPNWFIEHPETEIKHENVSISAGETITYTYMVRVNTDINDSTETSSVLEVEYDGNTQEETKKYILRTAKLVLTTIPRYDVDKLMSKYNQQYITLIENISGETLTNVKVKIYTNDVIEITNVTDNLLSKGAVDEFIIDEIAAGEIVNVTVYVDILDPTDDDKYTRIRTTAEESNVIYRSNTIAEEVGKLNVNAELSATTNSINANGYVYAGDTITYTATITNDGEFDLDNLVIRSVISIYLNIDSITVDGQEITDYTIVSNFDADGDDLIQRGDSNLEFSYPLAVGDSIELVINTTVLDVYAEETVEISNYLAFYEDIKVGETEKITYYYGSLYIDETEEPDDSESPDGSDDSVNPDDSSVSESVYEISGTVWVDENGDGQRSSNESTLSEITVYAINVQTNEVVNTATTNNSGFYTLSNLPEGNYIVAFEYDTVTYLVTTYQADGVDSTRNSDAVKTSMNINGETKDVAATDSISLNTNIANIDLGLIQARVFDLDIEKFISSITVSNSRGTTVYDQEDGTTLAQVQIASSVLSGTNVIIEYTIRVTNNGEVSGYATSIVDYLPSSLSFSTNLNSDWYQSGGYIYNSSLSTTLIEPGESVDLTLIVTKTMTNSNTGLINNRVEIEDSYNSLGITDSDNSDTASADVIIGIQTGAAVKYIVSIIIILIVICGIAYLINRKLIKKDEKI